MISVIFTCKGRPRLTQLCLERVMEFLPSWDHELYVCYHGQNEDYMKMLEKSLSAENSIILPNGRHPSRFALINYALRDASGDYFMHLENDFYWVDPMALDEALNALHQYPDIDYIRFEYLPFTPKQFNRTEHVGDKGIHWMKPDAPFRFTFNPHIRRMKYPCGRPLMEGGFTKQPEQHHNDCYEGVSCCMDGDNFRHLGIYDESGHYKPWYAERFTLRHGDRKIDDPVAEFKKFCNDPHYLELFERYLRDNGHQHD